MAPTGIITEQRDTLRKNVHWRVAVIRQNASTPVLGRTANVAANGACLILETQLHPGDRVTVLFEIPVSGVKRHVTAISTVVYAVYGSQESAFKIGVKFADLPPNVVSLFS